MTRPRLPRRSIQIIATVLLFASVGMVLAGFLVPPFLDRIYYRGPVSGHFDGERFRNPDSTGSAQGFSGARMARFLLRTDRAPWPERVPVTPTVPPARVIGNAMRVTWIGHSTTLVQTQGLNILLDPIWSDVASPVAPIGPRRVRAPGVRMEDLPRIDVVLVSHNHYDHMDLPTLERLWARDRPRIVTSLGNDAILTARGIPAVSRDWGGRVAIAPGIDVVVERVHHWGSRWGRDRNRALWSGFTVTLPGGNLFYAGDTGLGDGSWVAEAARRGPIRLAVLPLGAFEPRAMMQDSHIGPLEAADIFTRLGAAYGLGVHWGTFQLSNEAIDAPPRLLAQAMRARHVAKDRFRTTEVGTGWNVPPR
jgi:L-ascorbate metabolism protein UlaG (beta-lactamase superfamily)